MTGRRRRLALARHALLLIACIVLPAGLPAQSAAAPADSILAQLVSLQVRNASLADALARLRHDQGVPLAYSGDVLPPDLRVTLTMYAEPLGRALNALLAGSGLEVVVTRQGSVVIVRARGLAAPDGAPAGPARAEVEEVRLATGIRHLDQIVVMGSPVAGAPEREQPTAISVVGRRRLAASPHTRMGDLVRTLLPGVVLWDRGPVGPPAQITSVRGASSFTTRALKTYVDGIELASPDLFTLLDGRSVERIEVIRGPQGAALYGPDALNGILQIETRKGQPGAGRVRLRGAASAGPLERADLARPALWQSHALGLTGGVGGLGVDAGGHLSQAGSGATAPWLRTGSLQLGTRLLAGPVVVSGSARLGRYEYVLERMRPGGGPVQSSPPFDIEERGVGLTAVHQLAPGWRQTLVVGHHWISGVREAGRPVLLTPRLPLGATHETASRTSVRYSTAVDLPLGGPEATLSAGAEHSTRHVERLVRATTTARDLTPLYDDDLRSTGLFGQARLRLGAGLVASAGSRAEWSSTVGDNRGAAWASTAGLSWSVPMGTTTLRLRSAWGRGLRPPEPGMTRAMATATVRQEANPNLSPERQSGVEAGVELYHADRAHARLTFYDQRASDLIQQVPVRLDGTVRIFQFQNVGAITNRGVELEAGMGWGTLGLTGLLYLVDSRVTRLAPRYTGELRPGDRLLEIPEGVGALSLTYRAGPVLSEVGASWLGPWTGYDWAALLAVQDGKAPARSALREYWMRYPGVFRPYLSVRWGVGGDWAAFLRVDNPAKTASLIRDNVTPPLGRTTLVGIELIP